MNLFLAGHESTANALTWTWHLLSENPEAGEKLRAEVRSALGGRLPGMDDLPRLPYTAMVFSEALRLYPPLWSIARRALRDIPLGGATVAQGEVVILSQFVTHRDARWFPEPERFDPERWTDEAKAARPKFSWFPFSAGSRQCIGEGFAWVEAVIALAVISQRWRLKTAPGHRVEMWPQLTLRAKYGMRMKPCRAN
jgi:cytochrome P450